MTETCGLYTQNVLRKLHVSSALDEHFTNSNFTGKMFLCQPKLLFYHY